MPAGRLAGTRSPDRGRGKLEVSDDILMRQIAAGDRDAYRRLVERHLGRMVAFAGRLLADRVAAEDIAQEVFLRVWTHAAAWRSGEAQVSTWLHRIALNLCRDRLARRREGSIDGVAEPADDRPSAMEQLERSQLADHVNAALAALPEAQRSAIALCHYQGLRNLEAAEIMDLSVEALESLLARGRRAMRSLLRPVVGELLEHPQRAGAAAGVGTRSGTGTGTGRGH